MKKIFAVLIIVLCMPLALPQAALALDIQEVVAPKTGVKAWLVEEHKLPIISLQLSFQGGGEQDPADKQGLATLATNLLTRGAGPYDGATFQNRLSSRSIEMDFDAGRDEITGGVKCLSEDKAEALELLHLALTSPRFDTAEVERLRAQQLSAIRVKFSDPSWQARYALLSYLYANHPYSNRILGTPKTLQAIAQRDLRDFAEKRLALDNVIIAVAGDITPEELATALDGIFQGLPERASLKRISDVPESKEAAAILVRRDGTQTDILFGSTGPKRQDADYYASEVVNYILGGGSFASRLMQELRDKRGLTYGISTGLAPSDHAGLLIGSAAVDNSKAAEALSLIRETMKTFHEEGPTDPEIRAAKDYLTGAKPLALTSTNKIAALLVEMQRESLGRDYLERYSQIVRNVTKADIDRVIERYFNPDKFSFVMVGKPEGVIPTHTKDTVRQ